MRCAHCQGTLKRSTAPFHIDRKGYHLSLESVPAWVCEQCGEPLFDEAEVRIIQEMLNRLDSEATHLASVA